MGEMAMYKSTEVSACQRTLSPVTYDDSSNSSAPACRSPLHIRPKPHSSSQVQRQVCAQPSSAGLRQRIHQVAEAVAAATAAGTAAIAAAAAASVMDVGQAASGQREVGAFGQVQGRDGRQHRCASSARDCGPLP